jgi:gamma-butyrobetaine dioxygenase
MEVNQPDVHSYTPVYLGLHMDLLYFRNPPGIQLLHCLKNSVTGGASIFADSFFAANQLRTNHPELFEILCELPQTFHYKNAGEHYYHRHPVIELAKDHDGYTIPGVIENVNWSPPFQGPFEIVGVQRGRANYSTLHRNQTTRFRTYLEAIQTFAGYLESPDNQYEYLLKPGQCVIFNNRRTLHARHQFDAESGERWLKGAYVDTDSMLSKRRVLAEQHGAMAPGHDTRQDAVATLESETRKYNRMRILQQEDLLNPYISDNGSVSAVDKLIWKRKEKLLIHIR